MEQINGHFIGAIFLGAIFVPMLSCISHKTEEHVQKTVFSHLKAR